MKRLFIVGCLLALGSVGYCAAPHEIGSVKASKLAITPRTLAAINALTPDTTGQLVICSNCQTANAGSLSLCIATGSVTAGSWVIISSLTAVTSCR